MFFLQCFPAKGFTHSHLLYNFPSVPLTLIQEPLFKQKSLSPYFAEGLHVFLLFLLPTLPPIVKDSIFLLSLLLLSL